MELQESILHLSLVKDAFDVMVTGEKPEEYRSPTRWIKVRLYAKDFSRKDYGLVKFVNGYGFDKPYFIAEFNGFEYAKIAEVKQYSNGLSVCILKGDIIIKLGKIVERGNL